MGDKSYQTVRSSASARRFVYNFAAHKTKIVFYIPAMAGHPASSVSIG
jgi:hypothetical protein